MCIRDSTKLSLVKLYTVKFFVWSTVHWPVTCTAWTSSVGIGLLLFSYREPLMFMHVLSVQYFSSYFSRFPTVNADHCHIGLFRLKQANVYIGREYLARWNLPACCSSNTLWTLPIDWNWGSKNSLEVVARQQCDGNFGRSRRKFCTKLRLSVVSTCRYQSPSGTCMHFVYTARYPLAHWPFSGVQSAQRHFSANLHDWSPRATF